MLRLGQGGPDRFRGRRSVAFYQNLCASGWSPLPLPIMAPTTGQTLKYSELLTLLSFYTLISFLNTSLVPLQKFFRKTFLPKKKHHILPKKNKKYMFHLKKRKKVSTGVKARFVFSFRNFYFQAYLSVGTEKQTP